MLLVQEGGYRVCPWPSGLHKLWQLQIYLELGSILLLLHATLAPPLLPPVFNKPTTFTLSGKIVASYLVSVVLINLRLVLMLPLRSGWLSWMPPIALHWCQCTSDGLHFCWLTWSCICPVCGARMLLHGLPYPQTGTITRGVWHATSSFDLPLGVVPPCNAGGSSFLDMLRETCFLTKLFFVRYSFLKPFWWKLVFGLYIAVILHPVPRVVPSGFSLHPNFSTSILASQYESVGGWCDIGRYPKYPTLVSLSHHPISLLGRQVFNFLSIYLSKMSIPSNTIDNSSRVHMYVGCTAILLSCKTTGNKVPSTLTSLLGSAIGLNHGIPLCLILLVVDKHQ